MSPTLNESSVPYSALNTVTWSKYAMEYVPGTATYTVKKFTKVPCWEIKLFLKLLAELRFGRPSSN